MAPHGVSFLWRRRAPWSIPMSWCQGDLRTVVKSSERGENPVSFGKDSKQDTLTNILKVSAFHMGERSTFREQFLAEIDQIRLLRRRYWLSWIAIPVSLVLFGFGSDLVHPLFLLLCFLPLFSVRVYSLKLALVRCPRCGQFYNGDPNKPFDRDRPELGGGFCGLAPVV
jgi:hypothetical protein